MVCVVKHYVCEECAEGFDTMLEAKEHEKECKEKWIGDNICKTNK